MDKGEKFKMYKWKCHKCGKRFQTIKNHEGSIHCPYCLTEIRGKS